MKLSRNCYLSSFDKVVFILNDSALENKTLSKNLNFDLELQYLFLKVLLLFSTISALDNEELSKELDLKAQELAQGAHYFLK